jgi:hypothetical protein
MIAHIVLFEPKPGLDSSKKLAFAQSVLDLCRAVPSVKRISLGKRVDVDPGYARSLGDTTYRYAAILEFEHTDGLVSYLRDPKHDALGRLFWEYCERAIVSEVDWVDLNDPEEASKLAL